jgi:hypothetical protein
VIRILITHPSPLLIRMGLAVEYHGLKYSLYVYGHKSELHTAIQQLEAANLHEIVWYNLSTHTYPKWVAVACKRHSTVIADDGVKVHMTGEHLTLVLKGVDDASVA